MMSALGARKAKPRQACETGKCNTLFLWKNAFTTDRMVLVPFLGAVWARFCHSPDFFVIFPVVKNPGLAFSSRGDWGAPIRD